MKKLGFLALALAVTFPLMTTPLLANTARNEIALQQATPSDEERALYEKYYNEKDLEKKAAIAKEFVEKFPQSQYAAYCKKTVDTWELTKLYNRYTEADKAFFTAGGTNEANLATLIAAGDTWLQKTPGDVGPTVRLATATGFGLLAGFYKNSARVFADAEKALKALEPTAPPKGWKADVWAKFRSENIPLLTQYQGLAKLRQTPPDVDAALMYLNKSAAMKDGSTVKDPNTYLWRAEANSTIYSKNNDEYKVLTDDEKRGEKGKEMLKTKIYPVGEKIVHDYARVVALTANKADLKAVNTSAREDAETYYKILKDGKTTGLEELIARYQADVTAPDTPIWTEEAAAPAANASETGKSTKPATPAKPAARKRK
ncbi:MAG TPA: hypothetical protein VFZ34_07790 [Blastocatellia bacterium]|nr:hypothetical protein [Blastocatellia bacterium]